MPIRLAPAAARFPTSASSLSTPARRRNIFDEVVDLSLAEMRRVVSESISEEELKLAKDQAISSILLGLESSSGRAGALARQEIIHGHRISPAEIIRKLEASYS